MINILPIQSDSKALAQYESLLSKCFPKTVKFNPSYLDWLYRKNPDGKAQGFDAWDGHLLVAHYVCIPVLARVGGKVVRALLSLNTATHPDYEGRGLFTKLAEMTYSVAATEDFDCVYGVANARSTPAFVNKLGFQLVQPLDARIGVGKLGNDQEVDASELQFKRIWSAKSLKWRCSNPYNPISSRRHDNLLQFHAQAMGKFLPVYAELSSLDMPQVWCGDVKSLPPWRLFIGLVLDGACKFHHYVSIPTRFRPSPLNFIYRSLSQRIVRLEKGHISFSFLDFDAY